MSLPVDALVYELANIPNVQKMKATVNYSAKAAAAVGLVTFVSGVCGGPLGVAIGSIASGCTAYALTKDKFRSVPDILINDCTQEQKKQLCQIIMKHVNGKHINTIRDFVSKIQSDPAFVETIIQLLIMFLSSEMGQKVLLQ